MSFGNSRNAFAPKKYYESAGTAKRDKTVSTEPGELAVVDPKAALTRSVSYGTNASVVNDGLLLMDGGFVLFIDTNDPIRLAAGA